MILKQTHEMPEQAQ